MPNMTFAIDDDLRRRLLAATNRRNSYSDSKVDTSVIIAEALTTHLNNLERIEDEES